jgi:molecular chaperone GrpE (heat shock protein)
MAPVTDPSQDGLVVAVAREGYAIGDELLRPASVVVGRLNG